MKPEIHFAESAKESRRQEERLGDIAKLAKTEPTPASEPVRTTEDAIPACDRWKKKRRKTAKRIPGTVLIPNDVGLIDWWD